MNPGLAIPGKLLNIWKLILLGSVKLVSKYSTACLLNIKDIQFIQHRSVRHQLCIRGELIYVTHGFYNGAYQPHN
jgi:hypothetical protein